MIIKIKKLELLIKKLKKNAEFQNKEINKLVAREGILLKMIDSNYEAIQGIIQNSMDILKARYI